MSSLWQNMTNRMQYFWYKKLEAQMAWFVKYDEFNAKKLFKKFEIFLDFCSQFFKKLFQVLN